MHELVFLANKAFGFLPDYTLWHMSWANLTAMFIESSVFNDKQKEKLSEGSEKPKSIDNLRNIPGVKKI